MWSPFVPPWMISFSSTARPATTILPRICSCSTSICRRYPPAARRRAPSGVTWGAAARTGRKLVRVRAGPYQETVWEAIRRGRTLEGLDLLKEAVLEAERVLGLAGADEGTRAKRARTEIQLDSSWGSTPALNWVLLRGYQLPTKFKSTGRVQKVVRPIQTWQPTASPG